MIMTLYSSGVCEIIVSCFLFKICLWYSLDSWNFPFSYLLNRLETTSIRICSLPHCTCLLTLIGMCAWCGVGRGHSSEMYVLLFNSLHVFYIKHRIRRRASAINCFYTQNICNHLRYVVVQRLYIMFEVDISR